VARNRKRAKDRRARRPQAVAYRTEHEEPRGALGEREDRRPLADLEQDGGSRERDDRDPLTAVEQDDEHRRGEEDEIPAPLAHAAPDVELAEAQLALGRSELDRESESLPEDGSEPALEDAPGVVGEYAGVEKQYEPGPVEDQDEAPVEDEYEAGVEDEYEPRAEAGEAEQYEPGLDEDEYELRAADEYEGGVDEAEVDDQAPDLGAAGMRGRRRDAGFDGEPAPGRRGELVARAGAGPERRALPGSRVVNFLEGSWRELQRVQWPDRRQVMQATAVVIGFVIVAGVFLGVADLLASKLVNYILK
jgi:preprotein translocase subunit SecE